jgi:acetoin utilization protein AcuB
MTPEPVRLRADSTLGEALGLLALADVRHLPVVDDSGVVGMLSERDVLGVIAPASEGDAPADVDRGDLDRLGLDRKVEQLMSREVFAVAPDAPVRLVIEEMLSHRIGAVLVVEGEQLLGIVSYVDVLEALKPYAPE